jgi:hypothetical protein
MKQVIVAFLAVPAIIIAACNDSNNGQEKDNMSAMDKDTAKQATTNEGKAAKEVTPTFVNIDATTSGYLKNIVDHYLHVKNALANDNSNEASNGAKMISESLAKVDKSFFTPEEKKVYDENEEGLKEHAGQISKTSDIKNQRSHFSMLSDNVYSLVKAFGGGRTLYHDHCPMANDHKGAMWISEMADIKNPYMGKEMPKCGSVEEKIN